MSWFSKAVKRLFGRGSTPQLPPLPPPRALAKEPDGGRQGDAVSRMQADRLRAASGTILTSGLGVSKEAQTALKTLLGG